MEAFTIARPRSLDDALGLGPRDGAKYVAGGTDVVQLSADNIEAPRQLIELAGVLPATVGVPEIRPLASTPRPAGRPVAL